VAFSTCVHLFTVLFFAQALQAAPCQNDELYYGNWSQIFCLSPETGDSRLFLDLGDAGLPYPGAYAEISALNGELWYPGFIDFVQVVGVEINVTSGSSYLTGPGQNPPDVVICWYDIIVDNKRKVVYGSIDWPINEVSTKRIFMFNQSSNAPAVAFMNITMDFCNPCAVFSFSSLSTLDVNNNIYYAIEQNSVGQTWVLRVDFTTGAVSNSFHDSDLFGISTIAYNPVDGLLYGYLVLENEREYYNTSLITIDPTSGKYRVVTDFDLPKNLPYSYPPTYSPLFTYLDLAGGKAYGLYWSERVNTSCYYMNLKSIDLTKGVVLHSVEAGVGVPDWCPPEYEPVLPWALTMMQ